MSSRSVWLIATTLSAGLHAAVAVIAGAVPAPAARMIRPTSIVRLSVSAGGARPASIEVNPGASSRPLASAALAVTHAAGPADRSPCAVASGANDEVTAARVEGTGDEAGAASPGAFGSDRRSHEGTSGDPSGVDGSGSASGESGGSGGVEGRGSGSGEGDGATGRAVSCAELIYAELEDRARRDVPPAVRYRGLRGEVVLSFVIEAPGRTPRARIERSSGYTLLDQAALALLATPLSTQCTGDHTWRVRFNEKRR